MHAGKRGEATPPDLSLDLYSLAKNDGTTVIDLQSK